MDKAKNEKGEIPEGKDSPYFYPPAIALLVIGIITAVILMEQRGSPAPKSGKGNHKAFLQASAYHCKIKRRVFQDANYKDFEGTEARQYVEDANFFRVSRTHALTYSWTKYRNSPEGDWGNGYTQGMLSDDPEGLFKNMNWRGSCIMYDNPAPGGPGIMEFNNDFIAPPGVPPDLSRIRQATMREYRCFISVYSQYSFYKENDLPRNKSQRGDGEDSVLRDTYKIYVKILYRKLNPFPDNDGNPVYADSNIYYRIVSLDAATTGSGTLRVSPDKDNPTRGLFWNEEFVGAKARGQYRRWWQKGRPSAGSDSGSVAIESEQKPGWYIHEWEMSREEAFPDDTEDTGMVSEVPEEFEVQE